MKIDFINTDLNKLSKEIVSLRKFRKRVLNALGGGAVTCCIIAIIFVGYLVTTYIKRPDIKNIGIKAHIVISHLNRVPVTITTYNPTVAQCDNTPLLTANGTWIDREHPERFIAVSRDLYLVLRGKWVVLNCPLAPIVNGSWKVVDTMNERLTKTVDILIANPDKIHLGFCLKGFIYY